MSTPNRYPTPHQNRRECRRRLRQARRGMIPAAQFRNLGTYFMITRKETTRYA